MFTRLLKPYQKFVAGLVETCFFVSLLTPTPLASAQPLVEDIPLSFLPLGVPQELASIEEVFIPDLEGAELLPLIHIQSVHAHPETQRKIYGLLKFLDEKYKIDSLYVEGAGEQLNPAFFRFFDENELNLRVAEKLIEKGELTGAELFLIESNRNIPAYGLEEPSLYRKNLTSFQTVMSHRAVTSGFTQQARGHLDRLETILLEPPARKLLRSNEAFEEGQLQLLSYLLELTRQAEEILGIDLRNFDNQLDWPQTIRLLRLQDIESKLDPERIQSDREKLVSFLKELGVDSRLIESFQTLSFSPHQSGMVYDPGFRKNDLPRYLAERLVAATLEKGFSFEQYPYFSRLLEATMLQSELEAERLFSEIEQLFETLVRAVSDREGDLKVVGLTKEERLLERLLNLELTPKDYAKVNLSNQTERWLVRFLLEVESMNEKAHLGGERLIPENIEAVESIYGEALLFYRLAKEREEVMVEKILGQRTASSVERSASRTPHEAERTTGISVVITGGFHTDGLSRSFRKKRIPYTILTPRVTEKVSPEVYVSTLLGGKKTAFDVQYLESDLDSQFLTRLYAMWPEGRQGALHRAEVRTVLEAFLEVTNEKKISAGASALRFTQSPYGRDRRAELRFNLERKTLEPFVNGERLTNAAGLEFEIPTAPVVKEFDIAVPGARILGRAETRARKDQEKIAPPIKGTPAPSYSRAEMRGKEKGDYAGTIAVALGESKLKLNQAFPTVRQKETKRTLKEVVGQITEVHTKDFLDLRDLSHLSYSQINGDLKKLLLSQKELAAIDLGSRKETRNTIRLINLAAGDLKRAIELISKMLDEIDWDENAARAEVRAGDYRQEVDRHYSNFQKQAEEQIEQYVRSMPQNLQGKPSLRQQWIPLWKNEHMIQLGSQAITVVSGELEREIKILGSVKKIKGARSFQDVKKRKETLDRQGREAQKLHYENGIRLGILSSMEEDKWDEIPKDKFQQAIGRQEKILAALKEAWVNYLVALEEAGTLMIQNGLQDQLFRSETRANLDPEALGKEAQKAIRRLKRLIQEKKAIYFNHLGQAILPIRVALIQRKRIREREIKRLETPFSHITRSGSLSPRDLEVLTQGLRAIARLSRILPDEASRYAEEFFWLVNLRIRIVQADQPQLSIDIGDGLGSAQEYPIWAKTAEALIPQLQAPQPSDETTAFYLKPPPTDLRYWYWFEQPKLEGERIVITTKDGTVRRFNFKSLIENAKTRRDFQNVISRSLISREPHLQTAQDRNLLLGRAEVRKVDLLTPLETVTLSKLGEFRSETGTTIEFGTIRTPQVRAEQRFIPPTAQGPVAPHAIFSEVATVLPGRYPAAWLVIKKFGIVDPLLPPRVALALNEARKIAQFEQIPSAQLAINAILAENAFWRGTREGALVAKMQNIREPAGRIHVLKGLPSEDELWALVWPALISQIYFEIVLTPNSIITDADRARLRSFRSKLRKLDLSNKVEIIISFDQAEFSKILGEADERVSRKLSAAGAVSADILSRIGVSFDETLAKELGLEKLVEPRLKIFFLVDLADTVSKGAAALVVNAALLGQLEIYMRRAISIPNRQDRFRINQSNLEGYFVATANALQNLREALRSMSAAA